MKDIEALIPHRAPFLFVDEIESAEMDTIIGYKTFEEEDCKLLQGSFPEFNAVPGMILIESMAQCGGAGIKALGILEGLFGLISLENVTFLRTVNFGKRIKYEIQNLKISQKFTRQIGIAYVDGDMVLQATWMCARLD